jgi:hypothetical protein
MKIIIKNFTVKIDIQNLENKDKVNVFQIHIPSIEINPIINESEQKINIEIKKIFVQLFEESKINQKTYIKDYNSFLVINSDIKINLKLKMKILEEKNKIVEGELIVTLPSYHIFIEPRYLKIMVSIMKTLKKYSKGQEVDKINNMSENVFEGVEVVSDDEDIIEKKTLYNTNIKIEIKEKCTITMI